MLRIVESTYPSALVQPRHAHDFASVTLVLGGSLRERVGSAEVEAEPLSVVVKPLQTEHANVFGALGARTLQIVLDADAARRLEQAEHRLGEWRWIHAGPATRAFLSVLRLVRQEASHDATERAAYDAIAALDEPLSRAAVNAPAWLRTVRERLDDERRDLSVQSLADNAGVHPVYLARCFRRYFGCSITEHTQRRRVQHAAGQIGTGTSPLTHIAHDNGFFDQAHMCRAFRRHVGMAPSDFRTLVASA